MNPWLLRSPMGQAPWGRNSLDLFCICLVFFILYMQAWPFVHGIRLVLVNAWTKPYPGEDGSYINICSSSPPSTFLSVFLFEIPVLIIVSSTCIYKRKKMIRWHFPTQVPKIASEHIGFHACIDIYTYIRIYIYMCSLTFVFCAVFSLCCVQSLVCVMWSL